MFEDYKSLCQLRIDRDKETDSIKKMMLEKWIEEKLYEIRYKDNGYLYIVANELFSTMDALLWYSDQDTFNEFPIYTNDPSLKGFTNDDEDLELKFSVLYYSTAGLLTRILYKT